MYTRRSRLNVYHPESAESIPGESPECIPPDECGTMASSDELEVPGEEEAHEPHTGKSFGD